LTTAAAPGSPVAVNRPRRLAALALLASVVACGGDETPRLRIAIWSNYLPDDVVADFERAAGCRVETWHFGHNEELLAKLEGKDSGFDLAVPSDFVLPALVARGLLERVDASRLRNVGHLDPAFRARASDPKDEWSVPYTWGTVGIAWRADVLGERVDSWDVLADPKVAGQTFLLEEGRDAIGAALLRNGADPNSTDPAHLAAAKTTLLAWKKTLKGFTSETKDVLLAGEAWACQAYNGDVAQARAHRDTLRYAVPKEGGILWLDVWAIPRGARETGLAHRFLDHVTEPRTAARISGAIRYAVANRGALEHLDPTVRADPMVYVPDDVRRRCVLQHDLGPGEEAFSRLWLEVRGGG
jgi:spermidine/putrescine transport system substrate-binding protein